MPFLCLVSLKLIHSSNCNLSIFLSKHVSNSSRLHLWENTSQCNYKYDLNYKQRFYYEILFLLFNAKFYFKRGRILRLEFLFRASFSFSFKISSFSSLRIYQFYFLFQIAKLLHAFSFSKEFILKYLRQDFKLQNKFKIEAFFRYFSFFLLHKVIICFVYILYIQVFVVYNINVLPRRKNL